MINSRHCHGSASMFCIFNVCARKISEKFIIFLCVVVLLKGKLNETHYNFSADWISTFETFKEFK